MGRVSCSGQSIKGIRLRSCVCGNMGRVRDGLRPHWIGRWVGVLPLSYRCMFFLGRQMVPGVPGGSWL